MPDRLSEISRSRRVLGMLFLDGFYRQGGQGLKFVPVPAPSPAELQRLVQTIAERIGRSLERAGLITRDIDNAYLAFDPCEEAPINTLLGHSITYRIAAGPREGQKVFTLQTLPPDAPRSSADVAEASGFSLHAGVSAKGADRETLEHLARYIARPPIASERLALTERGHIRYTLKTPYRDGTTHVIFEPFDFIARLAVLVPKPRAHLTRFHGVFAPHSALRAQVVPKRKTGTAPGAIADRGRAPPVDDVGQALKARLCDRDRALLALRRQTQGDREHRGRSPHRADSRSSGKPREALDVSHASRAPPGGQLPL